jgi:beta-carotene ketolase (CrtW type)
MIEKKRPSKASAMGVLVATTIILVWGGTLAFALFAPSPLGGRGPLMAACLTLALQFLYCGLFITAHDACHGSVAPGRPRLNRLIGRIAARLYAGFNFDALAAPHRAHHLQPGTAADPDFAGPHANGTHPLRWGLRFVRHYMRWQQLVGLAAVAQVLIHGCHIAEARVLGYWALPAVLSAVQLFFFGTYLPHRPQQHDAFVDRHRTRDSGYPRWLSFLTCYHFGYHHVHHTRPYLPWYALPRALNAPSHRVAVAAGCEPENNRKSSACTPVP